MGHDRLLQMNPDPIRLVPAAQRDVWFKSVYRWRCHYEDGRGQCRSRETVGRWNAVEHRAEWYCERHLSEQA
jgi:hypothetical protein